MCGVVCVCVWCVVCMCVCVLCVVCVCVFASINRPLPRVFPTAMPWPAVYPET